MSRGAGFDEFGPGDGVIVERGSLAGGDQRFEGFAGTGELALRESVGHGGAKGERVIWELFEALCDECFGLREALEPVEGGALPLEGGLRGGVGCFCGAGGREENARVALLNGGEGDGVMEAKAGGLGSGVARFGY